MPTIKEITQRGTLAAVVVQVVHRRVSPGLFGAAAASLSSSTFRDSPL